MQHIANRSARRRSHHANPSRESRQAPLALQGKEPFGSKLHFQALELSLERADAGLLHVLDNELIIAARLIKRDTAAGQDLLTCLGCEAQSRVLEPKHCATQLRIAIF